LIIEEEETNGHAAVDVRPVSVSESVGLNRLTASVYQHKFQLALGVLALAIAATSIGYFTRPSEAIDSVAVMPFVNVNSDPNSEYLSDGISESIINNLSRLPSFQKVISFNSVLRYKGKQADPQVVGRELGVRAVLMGRLVQHGDDLSINIELVDVRDNRQLWGQQYNRKLADIIGVQEEISRNISEKLRLRLTGEETKRLTKRYTENSEAYRLYLMGQHYFRRKGKENLEKSIDYFEQAIRKDPSYAPAFAGLGEAYRNLSWGGFLSLKEARQKEEWATLKALQMDATLAEAHVLMANIKEIDLDWPGAEEEYKRALELDPNSVRAHQTYAWHLEMRTRLDEAFLHLKRAEEVDPLALEINQDIATVFHFMRQYDRAIEQFQRTIELDPNFIPVHGRLAITYQQKGMYEEAIAEAQKATALGRIGGDAQLAYAYAVAGKRNEALKILNELKELSKQHYVSPFDFALLYMGLGEKDLAFEWFNKTFDENPYRISFINVNPRFDSLRSDPRFTELLRRLKLVA
jgi:TolB-like protein/Tfp pilus assembly protein PilF